ARPPRPMLSADAQAVLARGPALLLPEKNQLMPLDGKKPAVLIDPAPTRLELVDARYLVIDDDLYRLQAGKLSRIASPAWAHPTVSPDELWVASIEDKHALKLRGHDGSFRDLPWHHDGNWQFEQPWFSPDGTLVLLVLREFGQPIDAFSFVVIPTKGAMK